MSFAELGINFLHIRAKSLTVLNPFRRVDEHIMDDADLAGPLLFYFCFATSLLFVSNQGSVDYSRQLIRSQFSQAKLSLDISTASLSLAPLPFIPC
jgi:hypothetical protein